jgi:hypothetical protein
MLKYTVIQITPKVLKYIKITWFPRPVKIYPVVEPTILKSHLSYLYEWNKVIDFNIL